MNPRLEPGKVPVGPPNVSRVHPVRSRRKPEAKAALPAKLADSGYVGRVMFLFLGCEPADDNGNPIDTGVESVPNDSSITTETGDSGDTSEAECGEIAPDEAGFVALFDTKIVHEISLSLTPADRGALDASPQEYVPANLVIDGRTLNNVGVRMRGPGESMRWEAKPSFRIDLRRFGNCEAFASIDELVLDAGDDDPAMARQYLSAQVFKALDIAAPNVVFSTLSVDGDRFGLYAQVEAVDNHFAAHHSLEEGGVVWEGKDGADFSASGAGEWDDVGGLGDPLSIEAVTTTVATGGDDLYTELDASVNMQQFIAVWAAIAAVAHNQSFPYEPGDAYLYSPPSDPRFMFIPWEIDEGWASDFVWNGAQTQFGLRCVYDTSCNAAFREAIVLAAAQPSGVHTFRIGGYFGWAKTLVKCRGTFSPSRAPNHHSCLAQHPARGGTVGSERGWLPAQLFSLRMPGRR